MSTSEVEAPQEQRLWGTLSNKIARRGGIQNLNGQERSVYEAMRQKRGMDSSQEAIKKVRQQLGQDSDVATEEQVQARPACACGCGGFPKNARSRFLPGHDARLRVKLREGSV